MTLLKKPKHTGISPKLSTLPEDISTYGIGPFLKPGDKAHLRGTSHFFNNQSSGEGLLQAVVYGDLKTVKTILAHDPQGTLLLDSYRVTDYSGRRIHQTAYQAALAAEDERIAALIQKHLLRCHGPDVVRAQQEALFPEGEEKAWEARQQNDLQALNTIIEAIAQATVTIVTETVNGCAALRMDETCERAMNDFRKYLDACKDNPITTGKHWNAALLQMALKLYVAKFNQFGGRLFSPKNLLVWRQVIGTIQRYAPANYARAFLQADNHHIIKSYEKSRTPANPKNLLIWQRVKSKSDGKLKYKKLKPRFQPAPKSYFPLDSAGPLSRLGYDYACAGGKSIMFRPEDCRGFRRFCRKKTARLQSLCNIQADAQIKLAA